MKFSERLPGDMRWDQIQSALEHERRDGEPADDDERAERLQATGPLPGLSVRRSQ